MRKIKFLVVVTTILFVFLLSTISVNAEILSVKNAWILHDDCIVVLRDNGDLLLGDSIDTQTPKLLAQSVKEFKGKYEETTFGERDRFTGIALHDNGDVTTIDYYIPNNKLETKTIKANAVEVCLVKGEVAYVDGNYTLNTITDDNIIVADDIKNVISSDNSKAYVISKNDTLYKIPLGNYITAKAERVELMTNVKGCVPLTSYDIMILRNNGDLYIICGDDGIPTRIGSGVDEIDDISRCSHTPYCDIMYINNMGELFHGNSSPKSTFRKCMDNVKMACFGYSCQKYIVTNDNVFYSFSQSSNIEVNSAPTNKYSGVEKIYLEDRDKSLIGLSKNNDFYLINGKYTSKHMSDVKDVIKYDTLGEDNDRYLFITTSGELWGAFSDSKAFGDKPASPFLTSFCQKQTVVKINKKKIELTAKIQVVDDRSMYPFRECLENMGATVLWDATNQIAIGEYNGNTIEFPIGKKEYYINGVRYEMDTKSYIDESIGRTYIPIRYAAEGLGFTVDWIEGKVENIIDIYK
ncbi:MAG: copper amine oxidase N-terminal domain-containing protein [Clostridia bacterium]|nr:copper amine oxidase N-terminal domain-containing protein [Clostridia bacterium]